MIAGLDAATALALVAIALVGGIGITTIGPGGIFVTIALFALASQAPGTVAGTASATFVATGLVGTAVYARSGELRTPGSGGVAAALSLAGLVGALCGVGLNALVSTELFGLLLGAFVSAVGALVWARERWPGDGSSGDPGWPTAAAIGFAVGVPGGLLGVGGPVLAVPLLVLVGVPMLVAVALAQVQSVFIAGFATAGYLVRGTVSPELAVLVGVPELVGVVVGWRVAHAIEAAWLKRALAALLVALGPYLAFG